MPTILPLRELIRTRRRQIVLRPIVTTQAQANRLAARYILVVAAWREAAPRILAEYERSLSAVTYDSPADIQATIEATESGTVRSILAAFEAWFAGWATDIADWHWTKFVANLSYATNAQLSNIIGPPSAATTVEEFLARNVSLIRSVSDDTRAKVADIVFRGLQARTPVRAVAKEINETLRLGRARSMRIASDQTVKLSSALDMQRQLDLGITNFRWNHSDKLHPRPEHVARDGKVFDWDGEVGRNDPPGRLPFCGCKAQGVIEV